MPSKKFISIKGLPFQIKYIIHLWSSTSEHKIGFSQEKQEDIFETKYGILVVLDMNGEKGGHSTINFDSEEERDSELERLNKELTE